MIGQDQDPSKEYLSPLKIISAPPMCQLRALRQCWKVLSVALQEANTVDGPMSYMQTFAHRTMLLWFNFSVLLALAL